MFSLFENVCLEEETRVVLFSQTVIFSQESLAFVVESNQYPSI